MSTRLEAKKTGIKKILIVDDEPNIVRTIADRLKMSNFDVVTACDGKQGIDRAVQETPDLILLDIAMPNLDGCAMLERLRTIDQIKETPVIMLTARTSAEDVAKAFRAGAADYVVKPFDLVALLDKIDTVLSGVEAKQRT